MILPDTQLRRLGLVAPETEKKTARLFFFDEANVSWCPNSGRIYRQQGTEYKVNTPGKNQRKYLIGSLEYPSGAGLYEIYANKTHLQMKTHWQNLMDMYPDELLCVVRDNASSHTTAKLDDFLIHHKDRLRLVPMPTYSPHLNLIERLWHLMRDQINRSYFFNSFSQLCETVIGWLDRLPFSRFQSLMGIHESEQLQQNLM
ncbi:IS630 family transposase [Candidatus Poribacteria bacterium]|nr:IS630 family transposase [Candidatus Poribacteria bacterium]